MTEPNSTATFFANLQPLRNAQRAFGGAHFQHAPDDWALVATDIVDSTTHIEQGRHKTINFVAAMAIGALKNLCAPQIIPFFFGGDGAVIMVPPEHVEAARTVLARVRGQANRDYQMQLRIGLVSVGELRSFDTDVLVARFEPSPGNNFGLFDGGGVSMLEAAIKQDGQTDLAALAAIDDNRDDLGPIDLTGLSCRWNELASKNGKMVTLIINGSGDLAPIYSQVQQIAEQSGDARPVKHENLSISWPPPGLTMEARARHAGGPFVLSILRTAIETFFAWLIFISGRTVGKFDPTRYRQEMVTNTDFCLYDNTLCFVLDCADSQVNEIERYLVGRSKQEDLRFGMHTSTSALMTCLVTSPSDNLHVHFVDGGAGGYTEAARAIKVANATQQP